MKRWHKSLLAAYAVTWLASLAGCSGSNIPSGTIRANGIPSSISLRVLPDTTVPENGSVAIIATVKDELGNPASGNVIFSTNATGQTLQTVGLDLNGQATANFTFTVNATNTVFPPIITEGDPNLINAAVATVTALIRDISATTNVTVINVTGP